MFQTKNDIPFVFNQLDQSTVSSLYDLCLATEPNILTLNRAFNWRNIEGSETSARYSSYNFFLIKDPVIKSVFDLIKRSYYEMLDNLNMPKESMFIQCWINIHRQHQHLTKHAHPYPMHGHITINTDNTSTVYGEADELQIPNKNGLLTLLGKPNVMHYVTPYQSIEGARVSIAFDFLPESWIYKNYKWRKTYDERIFIPFD
jgi:hypothetical protein